jgi:hypothetical protein
VAQVPLKVYMFGQCLQNKLYHFDAKKLRQCHQIFFMQSL